MGLLCARCGFGIQYSPMGTRPAGTAIAIAIEREGERLILRMTGQFRTGLDAGYLRAKADEIKAIKTKHVVVDLTGVSAIGSSGIGFLVGLYTSCARKTGGRFVLAGANARVREAFVLTHLDSVIPMMESVEAALGK
jgi:anti-anti-sigma factor